MKGLSGGVLSHLREVTGELDLEGTPYHYLRPIGRGGMGVVHLVEDERLGREVALKVLDVLGDEDLALRLQREARTLARLEHPNIVPVHDVGRLADGRVYYAMKYIRGERLDDWLQGAPPRPAVLRIFQRICEAVAFAHDRGFVHRDLKPPNIMVGSFGEALVMDWGLARQISPSSPPPSDSKPPAPPPLDAGLSTADTLPASAPSATRHGAILGTPGYMAPEQARGEIDRIDARSDVFSLGAILYFLLAGKVAFQGKTAEDIVQASLHEEPPSLRHTDPPVPAPLVSICERSLAKSQEARYASAKEMALDVAAWLDGLPVSAHRETLLEKLARHYARYRVLVLLLVAYLIMRALVILVARR